MNRRSVGLGGALAGLAAAAWLAVASTRVREDLPGELVGKRNPLVGPEAVAAGARVFHEHCASCHGDAADGLGPAADGLVPPPADFTGGAVLVRHSDAYLYWRISAGKPGTAMPSFHGTLGETERWQVVGYLRSLAPPVRR
ncbi:MAG: cytochrome c [Deltaproteobacteria bacterium]|nr:cytochrome c [Deltaproteobacteria bacterium]